VLEEINVVEEERDARGWLTMILGLNGTERTRMIITVKEYLENAWRMRCLSN
jgi:hypothetical protein